MRVFGVNDSQELMSSFKVPKTRAKLASRTSTGGRRTPAVFSNLFRATANSVASFGTLVRLPQHVGCSLGVAARVETHRRVDALVPH